MGPTGATGDIGPTGPPGPVGDYIAHIAAGTGVSITGPSGSASELTVSIGQSVGTTDTVVFSKILLGSNNLYSGVPEYVPDGSIGIGNGGAISFEDGTFQYTRPPRLFTDADIALGVTFDDFKPGDIVYLDSTQQIFVALGGGVAKDITVYGS
jgi:hypothetical protein